jgi:hypothetical protein
MGQAREARRARPAQSRSSRGRNQVLRGSRILAQSRRGAAHIAAQRLGQTSRSALALGDDRVVAKHRCAEQGACSLGDSVVACDVFLAYGEGHEALRPRPSHKNGAFSTFYRQTSRAYAFSFLESSSILLAAAVLRRVSERSRHPYMVHHGILDPPAWVSRRYIPREIWPCSWLINDGFIDLVDRWYKTCPLA